ncbi:MAG: hypothetical protein COC06_09530 [Bacteroidales bacterium]|nr:MAG: hypothetical protein COC06_09530 [Bacteroidales bacterium]
MNHLIKKYPRKKSKAGALQYVVAMSLLIFFLMGMFMLQAHYSNLHVDEILIQERLYDQLSSAKVLLKNRPGLVQEQGKRKLELFSDVHVKLNVNNWGIYKLIALNAGYRHHRKEEVFLLGDDIWQEDRSSLYLADRKRYLSLCGDTWIGGPAYLPSLGVRRSYVDGVGYYREKVIQGEIRKSKAELPTIRKEFSILFEEQWEIDFERDSIVSWEEVEEEKVSNSFYSKTLVMYSPQEIILENIDLSGRIKVISDTIIKVLASTKIDHCILIAPRVVFQRNCKMNCQVFAKDYVEIGQESDFTYPSMVFMNGYNSGKELVLQDSVHFAGELLVLGKQEKKMPKLKLKKSTRVEGFVYCDGIVEMEGGVAGSVYTNRFLLYTRSAMYENHLLNIRLDVEDLKKEYVGVSWFGEPVRKEIIEFLW